MPVAMPTPEEFSGLSWKQRDRVVTTTRRLLRAYGEHFTADGYRISRNQQDNVRWAESVREEARRLEAESKRRAGGQR